MSLSLILKEDHFQLQNYSSSKNHFLQTITSRDALPNGMIFFNFPSLYTIGECPRVAAGVTYNINYSYNYISQCSVDVQTCDKIFGYQKTMQNALQF
jgi:hypothetical protein